MHKRHRMNGYESIEGSHWRHPRRRRKCFLLITFLFVLLIASGSGILIGYFVFHKSCGNCDGNSSCPTKYYFDKTFTGTGSCPVPFPFEYFPSLIISEETWGKVDEAIEELRTHDSDVLNIEKPSISLVVVYKNETLRFRGFGNEKLEHKGPNISPESIFQVGSVTKTYTTSALFLAVEKGLVSLDDSIQSLFDGQNTSFSLHSLFNDHDGSEISISDAASQLAGLPREAPGILQISDEDEILTLLSEVFFQVYPTRSHPTYSNLGYSLLGRGLGHRTQMTYEELMDEYLFKPLDLNSTGFDVNSEVFLNHGVETPLPPGKVDGKWSRPCGGLFTSGDDLVKYLKMYTCEGEVDGVKVMDASSVRLSLLPRYIFSDGNSAVGSGAWEMFRSRSGRWVNAKGGLLGSYGASIAIIPDLKFAVGLMINLQTDASRYLAPVLDILLPEVEDLIQSDQPPALPDNPSALEGFYGYTTPLAAVALSEGRLALQLSRTIIFELKLGPDRSEWPENEMMFRAHPWYDAPSCLAQMEGGFGFWVQFNVEYADDILRNATGIRFPGYDGGTEWIPWMGPLP